MQGHLGGTLPNMEREMANKTLAKMAGVDPKDLMRFISSPALEALREVQAREVAQMSELLATAVRPTADKLAADYEQAVSRILQPQILRAQQLQAQLLEPHVLVTRKLMVRALEGLSAQGYGVWRGATPTPREPIVKSPPLEKVEVGLYRDFWGDKIIALNDSPEDLFRMPDRELEELVADLVRRDSPDARVELTPKSRDGGRDILVWAEDLFGARLNLIECKRYSPGNHVGVGVVRSLVGVMDVEGAHSAMIVTTSRFTIPAHEFAEGFARRNAPRKVALNGLDFLAEWILRHAQRIRGDPQ